MLIKHLVHQGPVIATIGKAAVSALEQSVRGAPRGPAPALPSAEITATIPPRPRDLVADYVRAVGGDRSAYKKRLPPHMFPQWTFPVAARTLEGIPYPLIKVLNGGCRMEIHRDLPIDEPLTISARLESIDDNGRRAVLHQRIVTSTPSAPEALVSHLYAIVPTGGSGKKEGGKNGKPSKKDRPRVPLEARELQRWRIKADAGRDFAMVTGDFNPVHWIPAYAKAFGFRNTILHGFATMARTYEGVQKVRFAGDSRVFSTFDVKFTRPLTLPAKVGLFVRDDEVFVGDAPGGPAYLTGSFTTTKRN